MSHQADNIFAGTQVVSLVEVRGTNNSLVHPRGAVGVVTRTPTGDQNQFLVRFPDGFEASFTCDKLEILKHSKRGSTTFCRHLVGRPIRPASKMLAARSTSNPSSSTATSSARAPGLDNDDSDTDLQWSLFGAPEQFEDNATQSCYWELQKTLTMALKANPNILECLYSPRVEKVTPLGEELLALRQQFLSQMIFQTFNGYAMSQFKKIEQDIRNQPSREAKRKAKAAAPKSAEDEGGPAQCYGSTSHGPEGVRWKHAMHLLRQLLTGAATLRTGNVPVRVEADRDRLLAVKRGVCNARSAHRNWGNTSQDLGSPLPWAKVDAWRKELHRDFERALAETKLPERPDYEAANRFLIKARREMANVIQT